MLFHPVFKPIIMAIHGSASNAKQWRALAKQIGSAATFIAPDLPGYGCAADDRGGRLAALAKATRGRTARIHLVGHSFGGAVALKFANAVPARIASVTLYDPIAPLADVPGRSALAPELDAIWQGHRGTSDTALMQAFLRFWGGDTAWAQLNEMQRARLVAHATGLRRDMSEVAGGAWSVNPITYRGPLTIFRGGDSPAVTIDMARTIAAQHSQTVIQRIDALGHMAPQTRPDALNPYLCNALAAHGVDLPPHARATCALAA